MAKIRGVKPDLWTDEIFVEASPLARLLWIGLWNFACDNGHVQDKSKQIKMRVLPTDDVNCAELLRELADQGLIERCDGWITIPNLPHHQKVDRRYFTTCDKPGCTKPKADSQRETRRAHDESTSGTRRDHDVTTAGPRGDGDGDGDGELMVMVKDAPASSRKRASKMPKSWKPNSNHLERALASDLDLAKQAEKFRAHAEEKGRTAVNWDAAFTRWLMNAAEYAERDRPTQPRSTASAMPVHLLEDPPPGLGVEEYDAWYREQVAKRKAAGA